MERIAVINRIIILLVFSLGFQLEGICQIKVLSTNYKEVNNSSNYRRSNLQDTVLIVFNSEHKDVEKSLRQWKFNGELLNDEIFKRKYPLLEDSCIELKFIHHPGPPMFNDIYCIDKANLCLETITIIEENETSFIYWFENDSLLFEKTLILIDSTDWISKESKIKGIGVQIYTTGSCKDLIEKN
ncbi:hypothetical protein MM213_20555 [Belliella sp. R4-6]|uniref:GLPGLI family protein n=1 Tax=Belliella alkalica TaxID=1730871 RepID=A0ABS9VHJ2_9BACT|nr:hypothetical protein [Belliella alkalica]MCH7415904.1 hypothetical protein [Belliella alkalica]